MSQMSSEGRKVGMFDPERRGGGGGRGEGGGGGDPILELMSNMRL